jgi:translation initiation factor 2D
MFKKPLGNLKTSAPLRNSDRRKLKQHIIQAFSLDQDVGDELVPDGLLSVKFKTHTDEPGVAYLGPGGDPLWFTLGIGSEDMIPTVYTLWKKPDLIPFLSTPSAVIPVLVGGADLMIPGVVQHPPSLQAGQLVSITEHIHHPTRIGPPLAVGHVAVDSDVLSEDAAKGKAVFVLHAWNDHLFDMGHKGNPPDPWEMSNSATNDQQAIEGKDDTENNVSKEPVVGALGSHLEQIQLDDPAPTIELTKEDVSSILHDALLQAMKTTLSSSQNSALPMPASTFLLNVHSTLATCSITIPAVRIYTH